MGSLFLYLKKALSAKRLFFCFEILVSILKWKPQKSTD